MRLSSISLALNRPGAVVAALTPEQQVAALFANNEQGAWYDPSAANVTWRRNLLVRTEELDNAIWNLLGSATRSANYAQAPDGSMTAERVQFTANVADQIQQLFVYNSGGGLSYTGSVYIKSNTASSYSLRLKNTHAAVVDNFQNITVTPEWQRFVFTVNNGAANGTGQYLGVAQLAAPTVGADISVWGAQLEFGTTATAYQRIVTPEITYLADVQSQPLLFTDAAGTTPVVGVESPVGLILDKRKGATLGAELVDTANTTAPWVAGGAGNNLIAQDGDAVRFTYVDSLYGQELRIDQTGGLSANLVVGSWYQIKFKAKVNTGSVQWALRTLAGAFATGFPITVNSTDYTEYSFVYNHVAGGNPYAGLYIYNSFGAGEIAWIKDISVKLLDGNHAYQTGSTARPVLRARYNLLEYSEQFNNGWNKANLAATDNAAVAPDGTTTADKVYILNATASTLMRRTLTPPANVVCTLSVYAKADGYNYVNIGFSDGASSAAYAGAQFDLSNNGALTYSRSAGGYSIVGTPTSTPVAGYAGWYRCSITLSGPNGRPTIHPNSTAWSSGTMEATQTGNGVDGILVWGADLRVGTSAGDYQRIAAATDYATTSTITGQPFRPYIAFDGTDDGLITAGFAGTTMDFFQGHYHDRSKTTGQVIQFDMGGAYFGPTVESGGASAAYTLLGSPTFRNNGADETLSNRGDAWTKLTGTPKVLGTQSVALSPWTLTNLCSYPTAPAFNPKINLYGCIIRQSLTASQRASVETYLASKTGVTL